MLSQDQCEAQSMPPRPIRPLIQRGNYLFEVLKMGNVCISDHVIICYRSYIIKVCNLLVFGNQTLKPKIHSSVWDTNFFENYSGSLFPFWNKKKEKKIQEENYCSVDQIYVFFESTNSKWNYYCFEKTQTMAAL